MRTMQCCGLVTVTTTVSQQSIMAADLQRVTRCGSWHNELLQINALQQMTTAASILVMAILH